MDNNMEKSQKEKRGIGGWLLVFILVLIVIRPIVTYLSITGLSRQINGFGNQLLWMKPYLYYNMISQSVLILFGIITGIFLLKKDSNAVKTAKIFLVSCIIASFIDCSVFFFSAQYNGINTQLVGYSNAKRLIQNIVSVGVWYVYLANSKRVENTYTSSKLICTNNKHSE